MSVTKRISGDYNLVAANGNIAIDTNNLTINGNLFVLGSSTALESANTLVYDNFITLNAGVTGAPTLNAGIEVNRGDSPQAGIRWNEHSLVWEINSGTNWRELSGTKLVTDTDPHLGGDLNTNGYMIYCDQDRDITIHTPESSALNLQTILRVRHETTDSDPVTGYTTVYAKVPSGGGSGLFIRNTQSPADELITRRKALIYSLIL